MGGPRPARPGRGTGRRGRPIIYPRRDIVDAIRYLDRNRLPVGRAADRLPAPQPRLPLLQDLDRDGTLNRMHNHLREQVRQQFEDRDPQPTAALIDSQSLRGAETVARASRGYDAGKKVNGRKRHIAVDTCGLLLAVLVTGAHVQDRDGGRTPALGRSTPASPASACLGRLRLRRQTRRLGRRPAGLTVQIVANWPGRPPSSSLHRRWAVERTFSWINRCRRTVRDYERLPQHHAAMVQWAMIIIMTRRLARHQAPAHPATHHLNPLFTRLLAPRATRSSPAANSRPPPISRSACDTQGS